FVVRQLDKTVSIKRVMTPLKMAAADEELGIKVFQQDNIKDVSSIEVLKKAEPYIIVTAAYGQILPKELLELPAYGAINVHASLLPKFRGGAPIHHAILQGEKTTGITIMYMAEGMDSGDIIAQSAIDI